MAYHAHSKNAAGQRHDLVTHLVTVAERAREFATPFGAGDLAYWAGLWHDLGKFHPEFQDYLRLCEANPGRKQRGPDHKRAGTSQAVSKFPPLAALVKGHHGGLPSRAELRPWLKEQTAQNAIREALAIARAELGGKVEPNETPPWPAWANDPLRAEFLLRMLFSALVDADCLDTERHFTPGQTLAREGAPSLAALWPRFEVDQTRLLADARDTPVNHIRREVYEYCIAAAAA